jgi:polar amino acid transport system substrate-binding protein
MRKKLTVLSGLVAVSMSLAACSDPENASADETETYPEPPSVEFSQEAADLLPDGVDEISVAVNYGIPPVKFQDEEGQTTGANPQLLDAVGQVLDIDVKFQNVTFDALIPGLESGRYDVIASIADMEERRENTDFIDFMNYGTGIMVHADSSIEELTMEQLCGLKVAYTKGTAQQSLVEDLSADCAAQGDDEIEQFAMNDANAGIMAVQSQQADAVLGDSPALSYNEQVSPETYRVVYSETTGPYGIGVRNDDPELRDAIQAALQELAARGEYQEIMELGVSRNKINCPISQSTKDQLSDKRIDKSS